MSEAGRKRRTAEYIERYKAGLPIPKQLIEEIKKLAENKTKDPKPKEIKKEIKEDKK